MVSLISESTARMNKGIQARTVVFTLAGLMSLYVTIMGTVSMGFCPGIECWPHTFAWILLAPCLLLAIWSIRAAATVSVLLLITHVSIEAYVYGGGLNANTLWGTDMALDKCFWITVCLLVVSSISLKKGAAQAEIST
jgi:hypothetical protein